jgi:Protein of unknown function (DUF3626)
LASLVARLQSDDRGVGESNVGRPLGRALDSFVEAQIHGPIDLGNDVRELVADPVFRDGTMGDALRALSARFGWPLTWHPGFVMPVTDVPSPFRGYALRDLARRAGRDGLLDAAAIGEAANAAERAPDAWSHGDSLDEMRTRFRRLWHMLVVYGKPRDWVEHLTAAGRATGIPA